MRALHSHPFDRLASIRRRFLAVPATLMLALLVACAPTAPGGGPNDPIKIGAILSTTGAIAGLGTDELVGAQMFVEDINGKGGINGRQIQLIHIDDESKPENATSAAKRLIQQDNVLASIGPSSAIVSASTAPIFLENKVPDVSAIGDFGPLNPYLFSLFPITGQGAIATDIVKQRNLTKFGVIVQAGPLAESTRRTTTPDFEKLMQMVAYEQVQPTDTDLTPVLAKIRSAGAEMVLNPMTGQQAALAARNFKQINYQGVLVVTAQNANAAFIDLVSEAADVTNVIGTKIFIYQDLPDSDPSKAVLTDFANKFTAKTGRPATLVANVGWDMMLSLTEAIKTAGTDREKIREALENQKGLKTLTGTINRSAEDHNGMNADWILMGIDAVNKRFVLKK